MAKSSPLRRPKGTGSISELNYGSGRVDAEVKTREWDGTVTRHRKRLPSRHEGELWIRKVLYEHERHMFPSADSERLTLAEYLSSWLESIEGTISRHTYRDYSDKVRLHITPVLGKVRLRDLTPGHLQQLYKKKLLQGGYRPAPCATSTSPSPRPSTKPRAPISCARTSPASPNPQRPAHREARHERC